MHFQQNLGCDPAVFVASFDFVDPGALQIAQNLFALDQGVINATLGDIGVNMFDHLKLPANVVLGTFIHSPFPCSILLTWFWSWRCTELFRSLWYQSLDFQLQVNPGLLPIQCISF